jgi:hypothetical protein
MTPAQARKILRGLVPLKNGDFELENEGGFELTGYQRDAVATLINALLAEPPAVMRARERLLSAALRVDLNNLPTRKDWDRVAEYAGDYADAVEAAKAKAKRGKR